MKKSPFIFFIWSQQPIPLIVDYLGSATELIVRTMAMRDCLGKEIKKLLYLVSKLEDANLVILGVKNRGGQSEQGVEWMHYLALLVTRQINRCESYLALEL